MANLLVVEDDEAIAEPLVRALVREGHEVAHAASGEAALEMAAASPPEVVVLDVGLAGIDGIEVCRRLTEYRPRPAILMLTARSSELDEVLGVGLAVARELAQREGGELRLAGRRPAACEAVLPA